MYDFAISAEGLRKSYGDVHALRGIEAEPRKSMPAHHSAATHSIVR